MMIPRCAPVIASASLILGSAVHAKEIPVEIHWSGAAPTDVMVNTTGGFQSLQRDSRFQVFRGSLSISGNAPQRRIITFRYGTYYHPFDIRIHRLLPRVTFAVDHVALPSCTVTRVNVVKEPAVSLPDAVNRAVAAGQLVRISEPNACLPGLKFSAVQARFRQNAAMSELSNGFFLINSEIEQQYRQEARARKLNVDNEIATRKNRDQTLEAGQLLAFRSAAQGSGNYSVALDTNQLILARISSDRTAATAYAEFGVTGSRLNIQQQYLAGLMRSQMMEAAAEQMASPDSEPR